MSSQDRKSRTRHLFPGQPKTSSSSASKSTRGRKRWKFNLLHSQRINRRAVLTLLGILVLLPAVYFPIRYFQDNSLRRSALAQARRSLQDGQADKAITIAQNYLLTWPEDYDGLSLMGELLVSSPTTPDQLLMGIETIDKLLRLDPDPPARQEDRKRQILLLIRLGDLVRLIAENRKSGLDKFEGRYQYANNIAEQRIKLGADDAEAYRLRAMTLERLALGGDAESEAKAVKDYQKALRKDPGDHVSAERLAAIKMEKKDGQAKPELAGADQILDTLVKARPRSIEARLVRARHFLKTGREDRAKIDLEAATKLDSSNQGIKLMAASLALRRNDAVAARRYLGSISDKGHTAEYFSLLSRVDLLEKHPDRAIETLRKGLKQTSGTDLSLTFHLALTLIQNGRPAEARPLLSQFRRLSGRQESPMVHLLEGAIRERSGRFASAIVELEAAREEIHAEWKAELELAIGRCYEATGNIEKAREAYTEARNAAPTSPVPRQALARLILPGEPDRSVEELVDAIRLSQGSNSGSLLADLAKAQARRQAALPQSRRDWSATEAAIEQGLRARPDDPSLHLSRARLLVANGRIEEAEAKLAEATAGVCRHSQELWGARARQLESRGRIDDAIKLLEEASTAGAAGDLASLRAVRSRLLARSGHGRAALELLTLGVDKYASADRSILARARTELLLAFGDRAGAVATCVEWAGLNPEDPSPGLALIEMARRGGSPEELEKAFELVRRAGGTEEPKLIAAQAIALLLPRADSHEVDLSRLDEAEALGLNLQELAPKLPATALVQAILAEQASNFEEAIKDYHEALRGDSTGLALPRLVSLLGRLERAEELAALKSQVASPAIIDRLAIKESLGSGDKEQAEAFLKKLVEAQPESLDYRNELARLLAELGKPEQAEAVLKGLVERQPDRPQPWLALLASQLGRGDQAAINATIERLKTSYHGDQPRLLLARCLWSAGNREEAARVAFGELGKNPEDSEALRLACDIEEANGRLDRAEELAAKARKLDPKLLWPRRKLALILSTRANGTRWPEARALMAPSGSGKLDAFEDRLIRAIVLDRGPDSASRAQAIEAFRSLAEDLPIWQPIGTRARICLAEALLRSKDPAGASAALAPLVAENASPASNALALAIDAFSQINKPEDARRLLEVLLKTKASPQLTTVCRAMVLKAEGDQQAASSAILEAAAEVEKTADGERVSRYYYENLARIGTDESIEQLARRIAEKWPTQGITLARLVASKGRIDEAMAICQTSIDAGSAHEPISLLLLLDSQGKLEKSHFEKLKQMAVSASVGSPNDLEQLSMATTLLRRHRLFEDEAAFYQKLLVTDPSNYVARNNLAWVLAHDLGRLNEGLAEADRVIKQMGPIHQVLDTRGMIYARLGKLDEAIADFELSARLAPTATHQIHLARAYAQAGRTADRRRTLESARLAVTNPKALDPEDLAELESLNP